MQELKDKYIDPFTDFGFKKLFGEENNKELLRIFEKIFATAEIAKLTPEEYRAYIDSLNSYRDLKNSLDYAKAEGKAEGKAEEKLEIVRNLKILGLPFDQISKATNLTKEEIEKIRS